MGKYNAIVDPKNSENRVYTKFTHFKTFSSQVVDNQIIKKHKVYTI